MQIGLIRLPGVRVPESFELVDPKEFLTWYDSTVRAAGRFALRLTRQDRHLSEDLVQEAYMSILRQAKKQESLRAQGPGLIFAAIRSRFIDAMRSSQASRRRERRWERDPTRGRGADEAVLSGVPSFIDDLSEQDQALLLLKYVAGYSVEEMAAELGMSASATASALARALRRARSAKLDAGPNSGVTSAS